VATLSRRYCKLCDLRDFADPAVRAMLREIAGPDLRPEEELHRKLWEYAMLGLFLEESGALSPDAAALAVAAGHEAPLYWLSNRIGRVVATDIYGDGGFAVDGREADASMLTDPGRWAPYAYRADRLEVQHMDALDLRFPDASFDVVFSLSSIEHFGPWESLHRAAREMARVLRPGGHLVIVTECLIGRHPLDSPRLQQLIRFASLGRRCPTADGRRRIVDALTPQELQRHVVAPTGLQLVQPLDTTVSAETFANLQLWDGDGVGATTTGEPFPHLALKAHGSPWTSVFLAMRKPR
jgi:SAM-dependent methyltransferase